MPSKRIGRAALGDARDRARANCSKELGWSFATASLKMVSVLAIPKLPTRFASALARTETRAGNPRAGMHNQLPLSFNGIILTQLPAR
jgi:hypothetical protein